MSAIGFGSCSRRGLLHACLLLFVVLVFAAGGCGRENPTAPRTYTLSGPVVLTGYVVDGHGAFAGTRVVGNADGVTVELTDGQRVLSRTTTRAGIYRFDGVAPGGYHTRTRVNDAVSDESRDLTVTHYDLVVTDTLKLTSAGDLYPVPNPVLDRWTLIYFESDSLDAKLEVLDLSGGKVRELSRVLVSPGLYETSWNWRDDSGAPAAASFYWITYDGPGGPRAQLLFR